MKATEIQPKKLVIFDIDDTLVNTQTKVHVIRDGKVVQSLNSHDFTHYKLQPGEEFDFGDFRNAQEFFEKSKPIIPMMRQLNRDIATGNKVVMVTARADFDDKELFLDTFRKYGVDIDKVHVYRAGNLKGGSTEQRKKLIIKTLLDKEHYSKAIMYDDAKPNLHSFMELKKEHPKTRFYAWHVSLDGKANEYMREDIVSERKRKKHRRAAYGPGPYGGYGYAVGYSGDGGEGGTESIEDSDIDIVDVIKNFLPLAIKYLELKSLPKITFAKDVLSKHEQPTFGVYHHDSDTKLIELDIENRHPMDIIRTLAHELVHYRQDLDHKLSHDSWKTGSPTENQAHEKAGIMMRKFDKMFPNYMKLPAVSLTESRNIEDQHPNEQPRGPEIKPTMPKGTVRVDVSDVYDWYKLGMHIANLKGLGKHDFGKGPPSTIFSFGDEELEHKYIQALLKTGLTTTDIDPVDPKQPKGMKRQKIDPTYNVGENFADGKKPGRKGLAKRSGVNCKASVSSLRKTAKNSSGEKARMAHWCANMKSGRAKKK